MAKSRAEQILTSMINSTPYGQYPQSRLEDLLLQLKDKIEGDEAAWMNESKILIADAITDRGIETSSEDSFAQMAENIMMLPQAGESVIYDVMSVAAHDVLANQSMTVTKAGKLYATMCQNNVTGSFKLYVNNVEVARKTGYTTGNVYLNYYEVDVNAGAVIKMQSTQVYAGYNSWCLGSAYVVPASE